MTARQFIRHANTPDFSSLGSPAAIKSRGDLFPMLTPGDYTGLDLTGSNDSSTQIKDAIADAAGAKLIVPKGTLIFADPAGLIINSPTIIEGAGDRFATTFRFVTAGTRVVRTQRLHPADGVDAPLSAAFIINAPQVRLENFVIQCTMPTVPAYGDWGTDIDCGVFLNSMQQFAMRRVVINGYWRQAGIYLDITQPNGGADEISFESVRSSGFWGLRIEGPIPQSPNTEAQPGDARGAGGMSSFYSRQLKLDGNTNFSTGIRRRYSDTDGGGLRINGRIPTPFGRLNNFEFKQTRISSAEPFAYQIDAISSVHFTKFYCERYTSVAKADGSGNIGTGDVVARVTDNARDIAFDLHDLSLITRNWSTVRDAVVRDINGRDVSLSSIYRRPPILEYNSGVKSPENFGALAIEDGGTTDMRVILQNACASGYIVDGRNKTYYISGNMRPTALNCLRNIKFVQMLPLSAARRTVDIRDLSNFTLDNVIVDCGSVYTGPSSYLGNNGGIFLFNCSRFQATNLMVEKGGAGSAITFESCSDFDVSRLVSRDHQYDLAAATDDVIQGIYFANSYNFTARQLRAMNITGKIAGAATRRFTRGVAVGGCHDFTIDQGFVTLVDQAFDITGSAGNRDYTISNCIARDVETWGFKFANTARRGTVIGCKTYLTGLSGFVASAVSPVPSAIAPADQTCDLKFIGCTAVNPGGSVVASGNSYAGFNIIVSAQYPNIPQGIQFIDCDAIDDRAGGAQMTYGFVNAVTHSGLSSYRPNVVQNCRSQGHTVSAIAAFHFNRVELTGTGVRSIPHDAVTGVDLNTTVEDSCGVHDPVSSSSHILVLETANYEITFQVEFATNSTGKRGASIGLVGAGTTFPTPYVTANSGIPTVVQYNWSGKLTKDATLEMRCYQDSGGALDINRVNCRFFMRKTGDV